MLSSAWCTGGSAGRVLQHAVRHAESRQQICRLQVDNYSLEGTLTGPFVFAANMFAFVLVVSCGLATTVHTGIGRTYIWNAELGRLKPEVCIKCLRQRGQ